MLLRARFCRRFGCLLLLGAVLEAGGAEAGSPKPAHQVGRPPKQPLAQLPAGLATASIDDSARRAVAGDTPIETRGTPLGDPELAALRDAELVLFPRRLEGFRPGWSWGQADASVQASGLPPVAAALPSVKMAQAADAEWLRSLVLPDFQVRLTAPVVEYLRFYRDSERGRAIARVWAKKVGRYTAAMQAELSRFGLPKDLVWLSLIESGHNPLASSPAGAAGLWQFIPSSGRMYGLTVDRWVDERLDPRRSTRAAARFLSDLYQRFGSWELAMAAYNMGHAGLLRSVRKYNTNDFWRLSEYEAGVPWETALYVPKIFAIAIVMSNRRAFNIGDVEPDPPIAFDTVLVGGGRPLEDVAKAAGVPLEAVRAMNPQYLHSRTPPSAGDGETPSARTWPVVVPRGKGKAATLALRQDAVSLSYDAYVVRLGDTLEVIAERTGTPLATLVSLNGTDGGDVREGSVLLVAKRKGSLPPDREPLVVAAPGGFRVPGRRRAFYRVLGGDTLESVATALAVTPRELVLWNGLDASAKLQADMVLSAYLPPDHDASRVRLVEASQTEVLEAGTVEFLEHFEREQGRTRLIVAAKGGETLSEVGRKYGLSAGMMERINRCSRHRQLEAGERVVVYAKRKGSSAPLVSRSPLARATVPHPEALPTRTATP